MIKVAKFGGSSVANAEQFNKVKNIVLSDPARQFVVTSACGKESREDHKVTDLLYLCEAHVRYGVSYEPLFSLVENKYRKIKEDLGLKLDLEAEFQKIRSQMKKGMSVDYLVSRGEYLAALLLAEHLGYQFVDAADVIAFSYSGEIDMERTAELMSARLDGGGVVIPGFYGALPGGAIRVMSRGGSDITGSVIANIVGADVYENWTDVSGIYVADPRIVPNSVRVARVNYSELRALSYLGANVLHDDAVFPASSKNIPINIRNTNEPENRGTMILNDCTEMDKEEPPYTITGITGRKGFVGITLVKNHSTVEVGFIRKLLSVFEDHHVSIEYMPSMVDSYSIIVRAEAVASCLYDIVGWIRERIKPDALMVEEHISLIACVGRGMQKKPGLAGKLLSQLGAEDINVKIIELTSDELGIVFGIDDDRYEDAIRCIYDKFIAEEKKESRLI